MEVVSTFVTLLQNAVLEPSLLSAFSIFFIVAIGEILGVLPTTIVLVSPLAFLKGAMSTALIMKILFFVAVPYALGTAVGSLLLYVLAYLGGKPAIDKFGKYIKVSWKDVERVEKRFEGNWYDELIFLALRSAPFIPTPPLNIAAGLLRMNVFSYFILTTLGMVIRLMFMAFAVDASL